MQSPAKTLTHHYRILRNRGSSALTVLFNVVLPREIRRPCHGYNATVLPHIHVDCDGFEVETLIHVRAACVGLDGKKVPSMEH